MQTAVYLFAPAPLGNKVLDRGKRRAFFLPPVYTSLFRCSARNCDEDDDEDEDEDDESDSDDRDKDRIAICSARARDNACVAKFVRLKGASRLAASSWRYPESDRLIAATRRYVARSSKLRRVERAAGSSYKKTGESVDFN